MHTESYRAKVLPNADIVAARFHVMKLVNEELNRARNAEKKATDELKDESKKEELQAVLKNRVSASNFVLFDTDKKYEALVFSKFLFKTGQFSTNN